MVTDILRNLIGAVIRTEIEVLGFLLVAIALAIVYNGTRKDIENDN